MAFPTITEKYGSLSAVGLAKELTFGTPVAATDFLPMSGCTIEADPGLFYPPVMQGQRDLNIYPLYGQQKNLGAIDGPLFPTNGIPLLVYALGTDVVTGTSPYTHTITQANQLSSLTVEKNLGNFQSEQWAGCRVNKYTLKCANSDSPVEITADVIAQSVAVLATPTPISTINELPFVFAEMTLTIMGQVAAQATNLQLDIENGLKPTYTFAQSHDPSFITPVTRKISGTFDVVFDSLNDVNWGFFSKMLAQTQGSLVILLAHPSSGGSVQITLPVINIEKYADDVKMEDVIISSVTFEAALDQATGATISTVVTNSQATAY